MEVIYAPDEERIYRAILNEVDQAKVKENEGELIKAVQNKLHTL